MPHLASIGRRGRSLMVALALAAILANVASPTRAYTPSQTTTSGVVSVMNQVLHNFWVATFRNLGRTYVPPRQILYYNVNADNATWWAQHPSTCDFDPLDGYTTWSHSAYRYYDQSNWRAGNSFYCPTDQRIYFDFNYNTFLASARGDNASGAILAHEYGHHIQRLLGWDTWLRARAENAAYELQADCFAGLAMRYAAATGVLAAGDLAEAQNMLFDLGDNRAPTDPLAHGTPQQRLYWFNEGYNSYSVDRCNSVYLYA